MKKLAEIKPIKYFSAEDIKFHKELITQMKSGEVTGLAVTAVKRGGYVQTAFTIGNDAFQLLGGVEQCKNRIMKSFEL